MVRVATGPTPVLPPPTQERTPTQSEKDMMPASSALTVCWLMLPPPVGLGQVLTRWFLSGSSNGLLPPLEIIYGTFCDTGTGGTLVLPALCPIGSGPFILVVVIPSVCSVLMFNHFSVLCF